MNIVTEILSAMLNWLWNVIVEIVKPYASSIIGFVEWLNRGGGNPSGEIA